MTALDDIEAATVALNALTAQEAAEKARIDAAVAAALAAINAPTKTVFLDGVAGLDTNSGLTAQTAVQTLNAAVALIGAGQRGIVTLLSDVTLTKFLDIPVELVIQGDSITAAGSPVGPRRTLKIAPTAYGDPTGGAFAIEHLRRNDLIFYGVGVEVQVVAGATAVIEAVGTLTFLGALISWDAGATAPLIAPGSGLDVWFSTASLSGTYGGKVFAGVGAGQNPNSLSVRTNLTAA